MKALRYGLLILFAVFFIFPIVYSITNSFMDGAELERYYGELSKSDAQTNPFHMIPDMASISGYKTMLMEHPYYLMKFWNSLGICACIVAGQLVIAVTGGYAFAKFRFPGRNIIFFLIVLLMMLPYQVTLLPSYIVLDRMGLVGNNLSLILPGIFSAFGVFLMRQVMSSVPDVMLDSAKIDGAGSLRILWHIMIPVCKAGIASLLILGFIDCWNMVEQPLIFLQKPHQYPFSVFLLQVNKQQPSLSFACGLLAMLPAVLLFLYFEEELIAGISYSALK